MAGHAHGATSSGINLGNASVNASQARLQRAAHLPRRTRMIRTALLLAVVGSLAVALAANGTAAPVRLTATVGPGYTITLKKGTTVVRTLKRGKYRITVRDRSDEHNFRLRGRSGRLLSSVGWAGTKDRKSVV